MGAERTMCANYSLLWVSLSTYIFKICGNLHQPTEIMTSGNSDLFRNKRLSHATSKEALPIELLP